MGYKESMVSKKIEIVDHLDRKSLLKTLENSIPFSVRDNPMLLNIKENHKH